MKLRLILLALTFLVFEGFAAAPSITRQPVSVTVVAGSSNSLQWNGQIKANFVSDWSTIIVPKTSAESCFAA